MSEFKGSKGEWLIETHPKSNGYVNVVSNGENCTGRLFLAIYGDDVKPGDQLSERTRADAALVSKAPEMLEMLEEISDRNEGSDEWLERIRSIIKSATTI